MEDIIQQAETFKWKQTGERIAKTLESINYPIRDLAFYEVLRFFDLTTADKLKNPETLKKVETIYNYFKNSEDILGDLSKLNSKLGNPFDLSERLNKIYTFVYSENLEKGFQDEKEIKNEKFAEELRKKEAEKKEIDRMKILELKKEELILLEKEKRIAEEKRKRERLKTEQERREKEIQNLIKKTKPSESPEVPKITEF